MTKQLWANGKWVTLADPIRKARSVADPSLMQRVYEMRDQGMSQTQIGAELGVHQTCVSGWMRRFPRATLSRA